jgi:MoaA/NifB/PqqE/SkfB family radical SAM enzyme
MVRLAKEHGCRVGTTTNGTLFDTPLISEVMDSGLDIICFSLAGTSNGSDRVRKGTSLEAMLQAMDRLTEAKRQRRSSRPDIHIAYMALRSNFEEVVGLPSLLQNRGVSQVIISTLDFIPSPELLGEAVPREPGKLAEIDAVLRVVREEGEQRGIAIYCQIPSTKQQPLCTENVHRSLFVTADGDVCPCVFTGVPVSKASVLQRGKEVPYTRLSFGNVNEEPLGYIWRKKAYRDFRNAFFSGTASPPCLMCAKRYLGPQYSFTKPAAFRELSDQLGGRYTPDEGWVFP